MSRWSFLSESCFWTLPRTVATRSRCSCSRSWASWRTCESRTDLISAAIAACCFRRKVSCSSSAVSCSGAGTT